MMPFTSTLGLTSQKVGLLLRLAFIFCRDKLFTDLYAINFFCCGICLSLPTPYTFVYIMQLSPSQLCQECQEAGAVLQCNDCVETTRFCPKCWTVIHRFFISLFYTYQLLAVFTHIFHN
jgi:hypothetical protein